MLLLALETSSVLGSCAICRDGKPLAESRWSRGARGSAAGSHSEAATLEIERVTARAQVSLPQIDAIAVGLGPGSFTGIRVGLSAAKALAYALGDKPIYAFDSCEILAEEAPRSSERLLTLVEAHSDLIYVAAFGPSTAGEARARLLPTRAVRSAELAAWASSAPEGWICVGSGRATEAPNLPSALRERLGARLSSDFDFPLASALARLSERARAGGSAPLGWKSVQPLYIRASEAEERLGGRVP